MKTFQDITGQARIVGHAVELDLVIIKLGGIDLVEAQESSDQ